jgi:hypothetical protein
MKDWIGDIIGGLCIMVLPWLLLFIAYGLDVYQ